MQVIEAPPNVVGPGYEMNRWDRICGWFKHRWLRLRRRLPYLVWWNDELDVTVTLSQDKLIPTEDGASALLQLTSGAFWEVEKIFREMGIEFDRGMGPDGRDWEWDWSLKGPISVRFHGRASKPGLRMERPKPRLVSTNSAA